MANISAFTSLRAGADPVAGSSVLLWSPFAINLTQDFEVVIVGSDNSQEIP